MLVVVLLGGALAGAVQTSLVPLSAGGLGRANLDAWRTLLRDPEFGDAALFTLRIAVLSSVLSAAGALLVALALRRRGPLLRSVVALPVAVPHLLIAAVAVLWLAPGGLAERLLGGLPIDLVRDRAGLGIVAVYVYKELPFLTLIVLARLDTQTADREEAAATLGAGPLQRLRWVVWPVARRPLLLGTTIVAAFVLGAFEVPLAVGPSYPPTLAEYAYRQTQADLISGQQIAAAALLLTGLAALALAALVVRLARDAEGA